jgi:hypothetical protein
MWGGKWVLMPLGLVQQKDVKMRPEVICAEVEVSRSHDIRRNIKTDQEYVEDEEFEDGEKMLQLWIVKEMTTFDFI